jgi:hypothetical protein
MGSFSDNPDEQLPHGADMAFKSVLDPAFKYRTAVSTDVRKTFERIRREQRLVQQKRWQGQERRLKLVPIQHEERRREVPSRPAGVRLYRLK